MATATGTRVLPAAVYDTIELVALAHGGIGAGPFFDVGYSFGDSRNWDGPRCAHGMAAFASNTDCVFADTMSQALDRAGISGVGSDTTVHVINGRRSRDCNDRVPFADWCREMRVVRGGR